MIYVVATTQMKPEGREDFIKGHKACIAETHKEKGCLSYEGHTSVNDPNVYVAGNLLWYPVEGKPTIRGAPDVLIAFGRPKGLRGSYKQWQEGGIAPQVVFEVLSPGNRVEEMTRKFRLYEKYGVEEYYVYDPYTNVWQGWLRGPDGQLHAIPSMEGWVSPRLGIRFSMQAGDLPGYRAAGHGAALGRSAFGSRLPRSVRHEC